MRIGWIGYSEKELKEKIKDYTEELFDLGILTETEDKLCWLDPFNIEDYFFDNWIDKKNISINDYYLGENQPDRFENVEEFEKWFWDKIKTKFFGVGC